MYNLHPYHFINNKFIIIAAATAINYFLHYQFITSTSTWLVPILDFVKIYEQVVCFVIIDDIGFGSFDFV